MIGQYRIISELVLFGIGIMITSYVIINFTNVQNTIQDVTLKDQFDGIADVVSTSVLKAAECGNCTIRFRIPDKVSDKIYKISIKSEYEASVGGILIINTVDGKTFLQRQLFNINYDNIDGSRNIINNSEVTSNAEFVEIVNNGVITIRRVSLNSTTV